MPNNPASPCGQPELPAMLEQPDWDNLKVLHRKTLPPRSNFYLYPNEREALTHDVARAKAQCLSGRWKFHLSPTPFKGPRDFFRVGFPMNDFSDIDVPGMWQLQGHGKGPQYTNIKYPWPVNPPYVPMDDNECGRYLTTFMVDQSFSKHRLRLRFEGVDSAFQVWINGLDVGYSQGARNPSEFDVTRHARVGELNHLAVEVYQRCDGSYLEDQDQWWLSGIFRDVYLHAFPQECHPTDIQVTTDFDEQYENAVLRVKLALSTRTEVEVKLLDAGGVQVARSRRLAEISNLFEIPVASPKKWTAETPYLYQLVLNFGTCSLVQQVGFRCTSLVSGVFCVNGKPIKLRGVNRHEHHPDHGRAVPYEFMRQDLLLMKTHNLNAIRTCHQLNDPRLYDLADELGIWVLDEADLECHGFGEVGGDAASFTSDNPAWTAAYEDRARQMVARDKNHPCVFMWSLGNESFYGQNHQAMYDLIKHMDPSRLVHYEGDWDAQTVDIYSRMYASISEVVEGFAKAADWSKPLVLCEFLHAMGNSCGNATEYVNAFYKWPRLMGGFVWEWANHGLRKKQDGVEYMAYGGDFGDEPNDGNFIMDGMVWSDHRAFSNLAEYSKAIEPVQTLDLIGSKVTVINRYDFLTLDHLDCHWTLISQGKRIDGERVQIPTGVQPHSKTNLCLNDARSALLHHGIVEEAYLQLSFTLRSANHYAPAGHRVAFGELCIQGLRKVQLLRIPSCPPSPSIHITGSSAVIYSPSGKTKWMFDMSAGLLSSWQVGQETDLLSEPIVVDFYRALTDNDRHGHGRNWVERRLHQTKHHLQGIEWRTCAGGLEVEVQGRIAPPALAWSVGLKSTYTFCGEAVHLRVRGQPDGLLLPETFARIGVTTALNHIESVSWFGRGPGETYRDKKLSQMMGDYKASIDELWVDYEFPQDCGNRTDVRQVEFLGTDGTRSLRANFGSQEGASFSAMHYSTGDIDDSRHPYDLHRRKRKDTVVRLDWAHHGQGGASCGPWTLEEYQLKAQQAFEYEILLD